VDPVEPSAPASIPEWRRRTRARRLWNERRAALPIVGPIVRFRLAALFAAQLFDFGTFTGMIDRHGIRAELNPIVVQGFEAFGMPVVVLVKMALVVLVGSVVFLLATEGQGRKPQPGLATVVTLVAVSAGFLGGVSNLG